MVPQNDLTMVPRIQLPTAGIHCRICLAKGKGPIVLARSAPFHNLVVDNGMNKIADDPFSALSTYCHIGTGTAEVKSTDNGLETFKAATNNIVFSGASIKGVPPYFTKYVLIYRFVSGTFNNDIISEVAFSDQATDGNIFSRALVEKPDPFNTPTTLLVRNDEWLDVTYEFNLNPAFINADGSANDGTGVIVLNGIGYNYTVRPANVTNIAYWAALNTQAVFTPVAGSYAKSYGSGSVLGPVTGEPTSPSGDDADSAGSEISAIPYVNGTFNRDIILNIGPFDCNATGGIGALRFHTGFGSYQIAFDPVVPKNEDNSVNFPVNLAWQNQVV